MQALAWLQRLAAPKRLSTPGLEPSTLRLHAEPVSSESLSSMALPLFLYSLSGTTTLPSNYALNLPIGKRMFSSHWSAIEGEVEYASKGTDITHFFP